MTERDDRRRFCRNCRHFSLPSPNLEFRSYFACNNPQAFKTSLVTGQRIPLSATEMRYQPNTPCGPDGNLWEPITQPKQVA